MRTNIDIDDGLLEAAMKAGPFKTKKDTVEAGLKLLARQAAYREILKWEGKLKGDGEPWSGRDRTSDPAVTTGDGTQAASIQEPKPGKGSSHGRR